MDKNTTKYILLVTGIISIIVCAFLFKPNDNFNKIKDIDLVKKDEIVNDTDIGKDTDDVELAAMFDLVVIDVDGTVDGASFEGGTGKALTTILGAGQMIPGFEEQIVGHKAGDEFEVRVKFPNDYGDDSLNGKDAIFKTVLHEVWRNVGTDLGEDMYSQK